MLGENVFSPATTVHISVRMGWVAEGHIHTARIMYTLYVNGKYYIHAHRPFDGGGDVGHGLPPGGS